MHPESDEEVQDSLEGEKSEESDSEPTEDVSWNEARKSVIEDRERAESAIQIQEERKKFKAREKHERNLQQKIDSGRKYEKLPESILQSVAKVGTTLDAEADEKPRANTDRTQTLGRKKPGEDRIRKQNIRRADLGEGKEVSTQGPVRVCCRVSEAAFVRRPREKRIRDISCGK